MSITKEKIKKGEENINNHLKKEQEIKQEMLAQVDLQKFNILIGANVNDLDFNENVFLNQWQKNKAQIYKIFGYQLKIEKEVNEYIEDEQMQTEVNNLFSNLIKHINESEKTGQLNNFLISLTIKEIKEGKKDGVKINKAIKQLINDPSINDDIDTAYSMFKQNIEFKGKIVLSIDPNDYLTMSENKTRWRTCHAIDGEYATGMISYLCDSSSIVAYAPQKKEGEYIINGKLLNHNSKKYRVMVHLDTTERNFLINRQYPNNNEALLKHIRELLESKISQFYYIENRFLVKRNININEDENINIVEESDLHYSDYKHNNIIRIKHVDHENELNFIMGSNPICPYCEVENIEESGEYFLCEKCLQINFIICDSCRESFNENDILRIGDLEYCEECYCENVISCGECDENEHIDETHITAYGFFICYTCFVSYYFCCEVCEEIHHHDDMEGEGVCLNCYEEDEEIA